MSQHSSRQGVSLMQTRTDSCLAVHNFALGKNVNAIQDVYFYKYGKELQGSVSLMAPQSVILKNLKETGHNSCLQKRAP